MDADFPEGLVPAIEAFLADDYLRLPGKDLYPEVFESPLFFPLQRQAELKRMIQMAREIKPRVVMEIGADKGGGLYHWCKCLPSVKAVIACEIRGLPYEAAFERAFPHIDFLWLPDSSRRPEVLHAVKQWLNGRVIDVSFIDGDKSYFAEDFFAYHPFMRSTGGLAFFHDIQDPSPRQGFDRVRGTGFEYGEIVDTSDTHASLKRAELGIPPSCPHESWLRYWKGQSCGVGVIYL